MPAETLTKREQGSSPPLPRIAFKQGERPFWRSAIARRWLAAWVGAPVLAIVNGGIRESVYKDQVGDWTANQVSVAPLLLLLGLYFWVLQRRWPLGGARRALAVGAVWAALSVVFEFGFGYFAEGDSMSDLAASYKSLFVLIPIWILIGPAAVQEILRRRTR